MQIDYLRVEEKQGQRRVAADVFWETDAFADDEVTAEMIRWITVHNPRKAELLEQLLEPLRKVGREDLVRAIQRKAFPVRMRQQLRNLTPAFIRRWKRSLVSRWRSS